jgi:hypothetical protein
MAAMTSAFATGKALVVKANKVSKVRRARAEKRRKPAMSLRLTLRARRTPPP